jgi:hypothetical protein
MRRRTLFVALEQLLPGRVWLGKGVFCCTIITVIGPIILICGSFKLLYLFALFPVSNKHTIGYSDYDVFLENDEGSRVYRCKKLF